MYNGLRSLPIDIDFPKEGSSLSTGDQVSSYTSTHLIASLYAATPTAASPASLLTFPMLYSTWKPCTCTAKAQSVHACAMPWHWGDTLWSQTQTGLPRSATVSSSAWRKGDWVRSKGSWWEVVAYQYWAKGEHCNEIHHSNPCLHAKSKFRVCSLSEITTTRKNEENPFGLWVFLRLLCPILVPILRSVWELWSHPMPPASSIRHWEDRAPALLSQTQPSQGG